MTTELIQSVKHGPENIVTDPQDLCLSSLFGEAELDFPSTSRETPATATPRACSTSSSLTSQSFDDSEDLDSEDLEFLDICDLKLWKKNSSCL